jgi:hypothetical protein
MKKALAAVAIVAMVGCGFKIPPIPWPGPTPTPIPAPDPTPEPPPPDPDPTPDPTPEPPPPAPFCAGEDSLVAHPAPGPQEQEKVRSAIRALGDLRGNPPRVVLDRLADEIRRQNPGQCVISGQEAVFLQRADQLWEEYHAVYFGDGSWTDSGNGKYVGTHREGGPPAPPPVEPPPVVDYGCPEPRPARVWTAETLPPGWGQDAIGTPRWRLTGGPHGQWVDTTALVWRNEPHCRAIGMSPMADGTPRGECPPRPDGHPDRLACERYLAEGEWVVVSDDGLPCERHPSNPAQFRARGGHCRLCNPALTVCSAGF